MKSFVILLIVLCLGLMLTMDANAGIFGRGGCSSCGQSAGGQCVAPELAPSEAPSISVCPTCPGSQPLRGSPIVQGELVRNAGRVAVRGTGRILRGAARVATAPFRWLRGGCAGCN